MPLRKRRKRPNWPYRLTWLAIVSALALFLTLQTLYTAATSAHRAYGTDWGLAIVSSMLDATVAVWFVAVGAAIGSFLNVVAYRLPLGRSIGGHSGCPYCGTPIDSIDNVPVLGWVMLRGRCRTCRLPISIQYPLVELTVAITFFVVFLTEFLTGGSNLPGHTGGSHPAGLMRLNISSLLALRLIVYLPILSGLIASALIAAKGKAVPFKLFLFSGLPYLIVALLRPDIIVVRWREAPPIGPVAERLDALTTMLCGLAAGLVVARLVAPMLYRGFDRSLLASDRTTVGARQFMGAMGLAGAMLGWQAVVPFAWVLTGCSLLGVCLSRRFRSRLNLADMTVWVWLGLLVFRSGWTQWLSIEVLPSSIAEVVRHLLGAFLLTPFLLLFRNIATPHLATPLQIETSSPMNEPGTDEPGTDEPDTHEVDAHASETG